MSLDYGYGDHYERQEAEREDEAWETAHRILHGTDSRYRLASDRGETDRTLTPLPVLPPDREPRRQWDRPSGVTPGPTASHPEQEAT